jgi:hypothetical protein
MTHLETSETWGRGGKILPPPIKLRLRARAIRRRTITEGVNGKKNKKKQL